MFLFHLFMLLSAAAAVVQRVVQREGEIVTLTCEHLLDSQQNCDGTSWNYNVPGSSSMVELVKLGQIKENSETKSDRLEVTADCSLIIKNVTVQDAGRYSCVQYKPDDSGKLIWVSSSLIALFVAAVTEQEVDDEVKLECYVRPSMYDCEQEVKWKIKDQVVDKENMEIKTLNYRCFSTLTLKKSHYFYQQLDFLSCEVSNARTGEKLLLRPRPSGDTEPTRKPGTFTESTTTGTSGASGGSADSRWFFLIVAVGLIFVLIAAVMVVRRRRTKRTGPAVDEQLDDPEDGVSYATVSYSKKTDRKLRVGGDDGGETVIYSTVRAASSSSCC